MITKILVSLLAISLLVSGVNAADIVKYNTEDEFNKVLDTTGKWSVVIILDTGYDMGDCWEAFASDRWKAESYLSRQIDCLFVGFKWYVYRNGQLYEKGIEPEKEYSTERDGGTTYMEVVSQLPEEDSRWSLESMNATFFWDFVRSDGTNNIGYSPDFDCDDFARVFEDNLESAGGDCGIVYICHSTAHKAHMVNYVNVDNTYIIFEPQLDTTIGVYGRVLVVPTFDEMESLYQSGITFTALFKDLGDFPSDLD